MNPHLGGAAAFVVRALVLAVAQALGSVGGHNVRPQHTGGTELGDFEEVVGADTEVELEFLGYHGGGQTGVGQLTHILVTPRQRITQLLINIGACIVQRQRIHIQHTVFGKFRSGGNQRFRRSHHVALLLALRQHFVEEVITDGTVQLRQVVALLLEVSHQQFGKFHHVSLTSREVQFHAVRTNILQQGFDIFRAQFFRLHMERERIHPLVQDIQCLGIGFLGRFHLDFLTNQPFVVVLLRSSEVRELTGKRIGGLQALQVFHTVERFHFKSFVCLPNEFLLKVRSLQVGGHLLHPLFGGNRRKVREEFFFTVCHSLFI